MQRTKRSICAVQRCSILKIFSENTNDMIPGRIIQMEYGTLLPGLVFAFQCFYAASDVSNILIGLQHITHAMNALKIES